MENSIVVTLVIAVYGAILSTVGLILRYSEQKIRLEVNFSSAFYPHQVVFKRVFQFTCVNVGKRPVTMTGYDVLLPDGNGMGT